MEKQTEKIHSKKEKAKIFYIIIALITIIMIFGIFDPNKYDFYLKCPFFEITDYKCPLCGSQRAIHNLINLKVLNAFSENILLILLIPYLILVSILSLTKKSSLVLNKWYKLLTNKIAKTILIAMAITYWILRNIISIL